MSTKIEQEAVREALENLRVKGGGRLTAEAVVVEATRKDSVLHDLFEWDAKKAAHAFRLDQARALIRSVRVVITTERTTVSTVGYVRDPDLENGEQGYVSTASLIGDAERSRSALVAEFSRAASALRRARELAVAFEMAGEVDAVTESVDVLRTKVEARVEQRQAA